MENKRIKIERNGPYHVPGSFPLKKMNAVADEYNDPLRWEEGKTYEMHGKDYSLCRCGSSGRKPFCDGTHAKVGFDGEETATSGIGEGREQVTEGPDLDLIDIPHLCARARFCHRCGGTWQLTEESSDPRAKETAIQQAQDCPSGRLIAVDKESGRPYEPDFEPSICVIEDVPADLSGPLWLRGSIEVESSDGRSYGVRNRQTICRCGGSHNKPFCDGTHISNSFKADDEP
jgi:CDGSH-type Zn-finger protein